MCVFENPQWDEQGFTVNRDRANELRDQLEQGGVEATINDDDTRSDGTEIVTFVIAQGQLDLARQIIRGSDS